MAHSSDSKADTVHSRAKRSCLNCEKYFIPKNSLPKYAEGRTTQTWCSKACYVILHPQVVEEVQCPYCPTVFVPGRKNQVTCGSERCKKELGKEITRKRYREDPEFREKRIKYQRKRLENPENREKHREYKRKRREDPELREKDNKKSLEWYHRNKEKSDGSQ